MGRRRRPRERDCAAQGARRHCRYLAECKLVSFPIGIYKVLRNVTDQIHLITLANNELKSLTSKFMTTFCQLQELHLEGNFLHRLPSEVSTLQHLKAIDLSRNQFHDFPEQLTTLPALETINLEENDIVGEPSHPSNSSWPPSLNGTPAKATPAVNLTFSSYYQHSSPVAAMFVVAYALIFLLCMVGNALVCFTVLKNRHMRTVTNMFILNLAVSDLLVGIFCMPTTLVDNLITGWPFDNATCKMSGLVQGMSVSASVFTLVAIAVERFRCIVHPLREKLTLREALVTIAVIWALALLIMCPSAVTLTVTREEHHFMVDARNRSYPLYSCWEAWPEKGMRRVYTTVLFSHVYLAPLALIVLLYARIARKLCKASGPARPGGDAAREGRRGARRRARVVHMLVMVALVFTLSWLPLWALLLLTDYGQLSEPQLQLVTVYAFPLAHWLAFFNSSANPVIYGYFNENFRRGFQAAFRAPLCPPQWAGPREASSEPPGGLLRAPVSVQGQPSDSGLPSESGQGSGAPRPGRLPLRGARVAHHGLAGEGAGCGPLPLTIPAWGS
ncbi:leucine-rich repeat-containing protein 20 isoform X2 [Mirounga angustirostris]|uniref:leucine-rich repeat-containing protein 20 isoform X2 n=1 Tax=Mirounga angustirostris TaxID=9716 RepID=UPI00313BA599